MTPAPASRPRLLVVAGPNGAGKTTITERGLAHEWFHGCEYINPDTIAQDELGDWNDAETVLRAAKLATERRETCLNELRSLAFETGSRPRTNQISCAARCTSPPGLVARGACSRSNQSVRAAQPQADPGNAKVRSVTSEQLARRQRATERAKAMVIHKGRLGEPELDFTPVSGEAAISLTTRLTIESFSLAGMLDAGHARVAIPVRFVPRPRP